MRSDRADIVTKRLGEVTTKIGSGSTPKGGEKSYPLSGVPFIRSMNVRMREFTTEGIAFIDLATHDAMCGTQVQPDDVLLNITGASIGRVACAPDYLKEANVNQHVAIIRPCSELNPRFLMYWLSSPAVPSLIDNQQKGFSRQGYTKAQIEQLEVPVPRLDEQRRIVAQIEELTARLTQAHRPHEESKGAVANLFQTGLRSAFSERSTADWPLYRTDRLFSAVPKINRTVLFAYEMPVPDKHTQKQIVKELFGLKEKAERLKAIQDEMSAELNSFAPALLAKAFCGEL